MTYNCPHKCQIVSTLLIALQMEFDKKSKTLSIFSENVPKKYFNMVLSCEDCMLLEMNHNYLTSKDV